MTDEMLYAMIAAGVLLAGSFLYLVTSRKNRTSEPAFEKKKYLFLPGERSFLGVLEMAVPEGYRVFGNVPLKDLVTPATESAERGRQTVLKQVDEIRVAFAICSAKELAVVGVVELDGRIQGEAGARRTELLERILAHAGIPVVTFSSEQPFVLHELKRTLAEALGLMSTDDPGGGPTAAVAAEASDGSCEGEVEAAPLCPDCSSVMVKRLAMKGPHTGRFFWTCSAYPKCRHIEAVPMNAYGAIAGAADRKTLQPTPVR